MSHCPRCPLPADDPCPGEGARRLCDLIDPGHPDHRPGYEAAIAETARQLAARDRPWPSAAQQAASLARSLRDWAVSGFATADVHERRRRMDLCVTCPEWDPAANRCKECGCYLEAKLRLRTEHCPIGRW